MSGWSWQEYFETAIAPDGTAYEVVANFNPGDVKRLLRGDLELVEHIADDRRFLPSDRLAEYAKSRAIQRGTDEVVDPRTGLPGRLWLLRSTDGPRHKVMMLNWACDA